MGQGNLRELLAEGAISQADLEWRYALSRDTNTYAHEMQLMRLAATWRGPRPEWVVRLHELESLVAPSLWVAGENDPFATPERIRSWASHARDATVTVMAGSGHQPWIDAPAEHARMLEDWWASMAARSA